MSKKMFIFEDNELPHLAIEKDAGNLIRIWMGSTEKVNLEHWKNLKDLCDDVLNT